jgi:hypothetical protein
MTGVGRGDLVNDKGYRIRCMRGLVEQIKRDYVECKRLWKRQECGTSEHAQEEDLRRSMAWLREELRVFKELRRRGIEGVTCAGMDEIERDVARNRIGTNE